MHIGAQARFGLAVVAATRAYATLTTTEES
jgi:hypothetical protein